jgi:hypothetical protein
MIFFCGHQLSHQFVVDKPLQIVGKREIIKVREGTLTAQPFVGPCPAYEGHFFSWCRDRRVFEPVFFAPSTLSGVSLLT